MLNEGLEVLGTDEYSSTGRMLEGVFQKSAVESVQFPSTLRRIEYGTFESCGNLRHVELPGALEYVGVSCFAVSGLEEVVLPPVSGWWAPSRSETAKDCAGCI